MSAEGKRVGWAGPVRGAALSLGIYLAGVAALAWAVASGTAEDGGAALAVLALVSSFLGGLGASGRGGGQGGGPGAQNGGGGRGGGRADALVSAVLFTAVLAAAGLACWRELAWREEGGVLLLCVLAGGLLASLIRGRKKRKRRVR